MSQLPPQEILISDSVFSQLSPEGLSVNRFGRPAHTSFGSVELSLAARYPVLCRHLRQLYLIVSTQFLELDCLGSNCFARNH